MHRHKYMEEGGLCEHRDSNYNHVVANQGMRKTAGNQWKLGERAWPCQHSDWDSSLQNCERLNFGCIKPPSLS